MDDLKTDLNRMANWGGSVDKAILLAAVTQYKKLCSLAIVEIETLRAVITTPEVYSGVVSEVVAREREKLVGELVEAQEDIADSNLILGARWRDSIRVINGVRSYDQDVHIRRLQTELAAAQAVIEKLPKTADGLSVVPGVTPVYGYAESGQMCEWNILTPICNHEHIARLYSTREAAEAAGGEER